MKICLVGNQNSGKTTLFNCLTGMNQKIGNWPGVTVEKKTGIIRGTNFELVDLPGIYSLNPYTEEEKISRDYILNEYPDIIINIIDATCLERSLYLTTQLLEQNAKVIVVLNMVDMLEKKGIDININNLKKDLNTEVCVISALKQTGIEQLLNCIKDSISLSTYSYSKSKCYNCVMCNSKKIIKPGKDNSSNINKLNKELIPIFTDKLNMLNNQKTINIQRNKNYEEIITNRYRYISRIVQNCLRKNNKLFNTTEMLDKIFLSKVFSIPIFIVIMSSIYIVSVGVVGNRTIVFTEVIMQEFQKIVLYLFTKIQAPEWFYSLVINGVMKGVGAVLSFVPQLIILFTCISILETTGYMSRIAFLLDNIFRRIGLSGKALIPFIIGSGCSVPGIMSSKILENSDERKMTSILVPFIPCSAKLPIIALFSSYFFEENAGLISALLYFLAIVIIILSSILMRKFIFIDTSGAFISELPDYKLPSFKYVVKDVAEKIVAFIKRAGSTIFFASIIIWFMLSFSIKLDYGVSLQESILAVIGKKMSWVFYPMIGVNSWEASVSAIQGLVAKEQVISSMSIISGFESTSINIFETGSAFGFFNKASSISFVIFNLFSAPCIAAISAMKKELGSNIKTFFAIIYQISVAWIVSTLIYQLLSIAFFNQM